MNMQVLPEWLNQSLPVLAEPAWCTAARKQHWEAFLENGLPARHHERWKYTDVSLLANKQFAAAEEPQYKSLVETIKSHRLPNAHLLVIVNGYYAAALSYTQKLPQGVIACSLQHALKQHEDVLKSYWPQRVNAADYPFANLNAALFNDGLFLYVPDDCEIPAPIQILYLTAQDKNFIAHTRNIFILGSRSKCTVLEEHQSLSHAAHMTNLVTHIALQKETKLHYHKIQTDNPEAIHLAHTFIQQDQNSNVHLSDFAFGGQFVRDEIAVKLNATDAVCKTNGLYRLAHENQYVDRHIDIDHLAPRTNSEMLYKGILTKKSRAVFNGRLHVAEQAQKILAYQANHNLLLSNQAEVYTKPELVIYADDVKCKHGATTGQIDQDALFYLRARGISEADAMQILLAGFAEEIIEHIENTAIKARVREIYESKSL